MVVFGGVDGSTYRNDAWALSLSGSPAWSALAPAGTLPSARYWHTAIYDPVRDRMVVFGGLASSSLRNDVWALSLAGSPAWSALAPAGSLPHARYRHTATYDPVRDRMVVFGGDGGNGYRDDVWALGWSLGVPFLTPTLASPTAGASIEASAHFSWTALAGAASYMVALAPTSALGSPIWTSLTTETQADWTPGPEMIPGQTYFWSVRALFTQGWGPYAPARTLSRTTPTASLGTPILFAPAQGNEVQLPDDFSWSSVPGAQSYEIQAATSSSFSSILWQRQMGTSMTQAPESSGPTPGQTYFWRVRALGPGGEGPWSVVGSFLRVSASAVPDAPALLSPADGSPEPGPAIAFSWTAVSRATSYSLAVSKSPLFIPTPGQTSIVNNITGTSRALFINLPAGRLYWKVAGHNAAGTGAASSLRSFQYNRAVLPLASCTILTPADGSQVEQGGALLASALVAGAYSGSVTLEWLLESASFRTSVVTMGGTGFETEVVEVPTATLGSHTLELRVSGPMTVQSAPVTISVVSRSYGPAARISLSADRRRLASGESTNLQCRVLDAAGRLVESDNGRILTFTLVGGGSLGQASLATSGGVATTSYTASLVGGQASVTAVSDVVTGSSVTLVTEAMELERLKAEAREYLDRLEHLTWDSFNGSFALSRSLNVTKPGANARSLVDNASPGDEQRLRRLNMFLRVLDRSWYYNPDADHAGPGESGGNILGAQTLFDDAARSIGTLYLALIQTISQMRFAASPGSEVDKQLANMGKLFVTDMLEIVKQLLDLVPDREIRRQLLDLWRDLQVAVSQWVQTNNGLSMAAMLEYPARAFLADAGATRGFVDRAQPYLDHVVSYLSAPQWTGGNDSPAAATTEQALVELREKTSHYHAEFMGPFERFGIVSFLSTLQAQIGSFILTPGASELNTVSSTLNRAIAAAIVWAAGIDCQTTALRISGPGLLGTTADAVLGNYGASTSASAVEFDLALDSSEQRTSGVSQTLLRSSRGLKTMLADQADALVTYESSLSELEDALAARDTARVRVAAAAVAERGNDLPEKWSRLSGAWISTSASARTTYPRFPAVADSMTSGLLSVLRTGSDALLRADWWLAEPSDAAMALLAEQEVRLCAELSRTYQDQLSSFLLDLLNDPSEPYLHVDAPESPTRMALGQTGRVQVAVRNVGAATAHDVVVTLIADTTQLAILGPATTRDSLAAGDSLQCSWDIRMLAPAAAAESVTVFVAAISATGSDGFGSTRPVLVWNAPAGSVSTPNNTPPAVTALRAVTPNPSAGQHVFEIRVASRDRVYALDLFNVLGQCVWHRALNGFAPGTYYLRWDGRMAGGAVAPPGVYFASLIADRGQQTRRFIRLR